MSQEQNNPALIHPTLAGQIGMWELFPGTDVLGIRELDRFIQVPSLKRNVVMHALSRMDGQHSLEDISNSLRAAGWAVDVPGLYRKLAHAGLIAGIPFYGDMNRLSLRLVEVKLTHLFERARWLRKLYPLLLCLSVLIILGGAAALVYSGMDWRHFGLRPKVWRPIGALQWTVVIAAVLLSIMLHEGAHAVTALRYGLAPSRIRLLGYLGFIPYIVLSIPGLYTIPPRNRLKVWLAGPIGSLTVAALAQIIVMFMGAGFPHRYFSTLAAVNLGIAIWNLCPLVPTDGYFILCTLSRVHNIRSNAWRAVADLFRKRRRPAKILILYGIISLTVLVIVWQRSVSRILAYFSHSFLGYGLVLLVTAWLIFRQVYIVMSRRSLPGLGKGNKS